LVFIVFNGRHAFAALRFVSFLSREKKEPLGGGEPRQARAKDKPSIVILNAVKNLSKRSFAALRMTEKKGKQVRLRRIYAKIIQHDDRGRLSG